MKYIERELFGGVIYQDKETDFLSGTTLLSLGNQWRSDMGFCRFDFKQWQALKPVKKLIDDISMRYPLRGAKKVYRGNVVSVWVHPELFINMVLAIDQNMNIKKYYWMNQYMPEYIDANIRSYDIMCGAIYNRTTKKTSFHKDIEDVTKKILLKIGVNGMDQMDNSQWSVFNSVCKDVVGLLLVVIRVNHAVNLALKNIKPMANSAW